MSQRLLLCLEEYAPVSALASVCSVAWTACLTSMSVAGSAGRYAAAGLRRQRAGDMVQPGVDVDDLAGDAGSQVAAQPDRRPANVVDRDVAAQRRDRRELLLFGAETRDRAGRESADRAGAERVHANVVIPQIARQVAHAGFERRLRDP